MGQELQSETLTELQDLNILKVEAWDEELMIFFGMLCSYRSAGGHLNHRDVHLADVSVQTAQLLECTAAVHAGEEGDAFSL